MEKITIITPTYNDCESIIETLDSVRLQSYDNWEHIIMDDGSTDNTEKVIKDYIKKYNLKTKTKYMKQTNQDQLNAINNSLKYITGDYIYILHSDDLLPYDNFFEDCVESFKDFNGDSIIGDLEIINENSKYVTTWKANKYIERNRTFCYVILKNGSNIYADVGFHKKKAYIEKIKENYLKWNTPFWIDFNNETPKQLKVKNVSFPILKYRIHENNYIMSDIGKHNVLTGELRTLVQLMKHYYIPMYNIQQKLFNLTRKRYIRNLNLTFKFPIIYFKKTEKNKSKLILNTIKKYYNNDYKNNRWLCALEMFYKSTNEEIIKIEKVKKEDIYYGSDLRKFTKDLFNDKLPKIYYELFDYMKKGFKKIIVNTTSEKEYIADICKFICIYPYVKIEVKEK